LATGERYDDPFGAALLDMWVARSDDGGAWVKQRKLSDTEIIATAGFFATPIEKAHSERVRLPVEVVIGIENTRATSLSWGEDTRRRFTEELRDQLRSQPEVSLTQETSLAMAQLLPRPQRRHRGARDRLAMGVVLAVANRHCLAALRSWWPVQAAGRAALAFTPAWWGKLRCSRV
jgi:hypothetical protein